MGIDVHFTEQDWERIARDWTAWWAGDLNRPLVMIEGTDALDVFEDLASNFPPEVPVEAVLDHYQARLEATRFYGDAWPKWWPNFGPGIAAGFLGAQVHSVERTVWFEPAPADCEDEVEIALLSV